MIWVFFAAGFTGWLLVHMTRPYARKQRLSSAMFFRDLPPPKEKQPRFRLTVPLGSPPFWLQLLWWILVLLALALMQHNMRVQGGAARGVWLLIDTSASMSTLHGQGTRFDAALDAASGVLDQLSGLSEVPCLRLSAFDLERRDLIQEGTPQMANQVLSELSPRAHDTDLSIATQVWKLLEGTSEAGCSPTHLVVISDRGAPEWAINQRDGRLLWLDVSEPRENHGFAGVEAARDPLSGETRSLTVITAAYGGAPGNVIVRIEEPNGNVFLEQPLIFNLEGTARTAFAPSSAGLYRVSLEPQGDYAFDDVLEIAVPPAGSLRVDWQFQDRRLPVQAGWQMTAEEPDLRVLPAGEALPDDQVPTLLIGSGRDEPRSVYDFLEDDLLLADLNLDVLESLGLATVPLLDGFDPLLRAENGEVWAAKRNEPPALLISAPPRWTQDDRGRFSTTLFFNGLRWLLNSPDSVLEARLMPDMANADYGLSLDGKEGNTAQYAASSGDLAYLTGARRVDSRQPIWPIFIALAAILLMAERGLAAFGGGRWQ